MDDYARNKGRPANYKLDRGGMPAEFGPFNGIVKSNIDPTRSGRLKVYIDAFGDGNEDDGTKWTTVSYLPSYYGATPAPQQAPDGTGTFPGNRSSYGMWFTTPDIGVNVICIFVNGDRSQGYYIGVAPEQGINHMIPAIGAEANYVTGNKNQEAYFAGAPLLPVTEINTASVATDESPRFFSAKKPVQSVVASALFQQGVAKDIERGPIQSSSQRETPSTCYGISTPGTPVYQGGLDPQTIQKRLSAGDLTPQEVQVIGRMGGHTLVMDDGSLDGANQLFRLRTAKGHQITMNDTGNFFYIIHANGQTWLEFGSEGTIDVFSTNSVNIRTQGDINLHADRDINMYAGRNIKMKSNEAFHAEATTSMTLTSQGAFTAYSKSTIGVKADGSLALDSAGGSWSGGGSISLSAGGIDLNGPAAAPVAAPNPITKTIMDDTAFKTSTGWQVNPGALESIVSRAPTHEPYPYHNKGVDVVVAFEEGQPDPPPGAEPVPAGVEIVAK